jgi:hypothetical protein
MGEGFENNIKKLLYPADEVFNSCSYFMVK